MSSSCGSSGCGPRLSSASTRIGCGAVFSCSRMPRLASKRRPWRVSVWWPCEGCGHGGGAHMSEKSRSNFIRCWPPSTSSVVPVIERFSSANFTVATTSSGVEERPSGDSLCNCANLSSSQHVARQREAGRHAHHAHARREGQCQQRRSGFQRGLRQRVAQEVGVRVPQLLVEQMDNRALRVARSSRVRCSACASRMAAPVLLRAWRSTSA